MDRLIEIPGFVTAQGRRVVVADNLRYCADDGALHPVTPPKAALATSLAPVFVLDHCRRGRVAVFASGTMVSYSLLDAENPVMAEVGTVRGEVRSVVATSATRLTVMTTLAAVMLTVDEETGQVAMLGELPEFPALRFKDMPVMTLSTKIHGARLRGEYDVRSTCLDGDDTRDLTEDVMSAYEDLAVTAAASGYFLQPVVARYRLEDTGGAALYVSPPVMVCAPSGFQCTGRRSMAMADGYSRREDGTLGAEVYRMVLSGSRGGLPERWAAEVARLVVEVSEQLHPVDFGGQVTTAIERTGTDSASVAWRFPGMSAGMADAPRLIQGLVRSVVNAGDEAFRVAAVFARPFASEEVSFTIDPPGAVHSSPRDQAAALKRLEGLAVKAVTGGVTQRCRLPHRFVAATGAVAGESVLWGDLTLQRFEGYPVDSFAMGASEDQPWEAAVVVTMASGEERVAVSSSGVTGAPVALSPLLSYPSADASEMTVMISRSGVLYRFNCRLTASADGRSAFYIDPGLKPIVPEATGGQFIVPATKALSEQCPSAVVTVPATDPLNAVAESSVPPGRVTAIAVSPVSGALWDSGRLRVYLMTDSGIMLGRHTKAGFSDIRRIDFRGVASPSCVALTADRTRPLAVIAGNDLVAVSGSKVATLSRGVGMTAVGWDSVTGDLWLADSSGNVAVEPPEGGRFTLSSVVAAGLVTTARGLLVATPSGLLDTGRGTEAGVAAVVLQYEVMLPEAVSGGHVPALSPWRVGEASLDMAAESAEIEVSFLCSDAPSPSVQAGEYSHPVAGCRLLGAGYKVSGSVAGTLRFARLNIVPRRRITLLLTGRMDKGAHIIGAALLCRHR